MIKGEIFIFTAGEYSDFGITAKLQALVAFDLDEEVRQFPSPPINPSREQRPYFRVIEFIEHLQAKGLVVEVPLRALHLGDYGYPPELPLKDYRNEDSYVDATVVGFATCIKHSDCRENPLTLGERCLQGQIEGKP